MRLTAAFVVILGIAAAIQLQAVQADLEMVEARGPFGTTAQRVNWGPNNCLNNGGNSQRTLIWMDFKGCNGARIQVDARGRDYWQRLIDIVDEWHYDPPAAVTGAYNCRLITNGNDLSLHAYGIAADLWWDLNPYGPTLITNMPRGMVDEIKAIRTTAGDKVFGWGGDYSGNKDAMHYEFVASPAELARGIAPRTCTIAGIIPGMCVHNSRCGGGLPSPSCPSDAPSIVCCPAGSPTPANPPIAVGQDQCAARGGTCRTSGCTAGTATGLCPGSSANRCCLDGTGQGAGGGTGGNAGTFTPPPPRTCTVGGVTGVCMHESRCTGTKTAGQCPGSNAIKCCTGGNGVPATCNAVNPNTPTPQVPPQVPPETPPQVPPTVPPLPTVEEGVGTPCVVNGVNGLCMAVADCVGTITANKCPGSSNVKCCTPSNGTPGGNTPPPSGGGSTNGVGQACIANGIAGTCKLTSDCSGTKTAGLCPGPSNVQCCTSGGGPNNGGPPGGSGTGDAQHIGKPCTASNVPGTCQNVNVCTGKSTAGLCPGSSQIQCCTPNNTPGGNTPNPPGGNTNPPSGGGPTCRANGLTGTCQDRRTCTGDLTNNLCGGGSETKCCTALQLVTTAGRGTDVVCSIQPKVRINLNGLSGLDKTMAIIFNSKASFLYKAAAILGCRPGPLAATLYKESRGDGFGPDGRMTVRLENHILYREYTNSGGVASRVALFDQFFAPHSGSANHVYTNTPGGAKVSFHGNQGKEWDALGTAQTRLSDTAGILSHSMGVAQIMGFNWKSTGFSSPQDMFRKMSSSLEEQLNAYVKFIQNAPVCLTAIRVPNYRDFARCYNGNPDYGIEMEQAAIAYDRVTVGMCGNSVGEVGRCVPAGSCGAGNTQQTGLCGGSNVCCMPIARPPFTPIASPGSCTDSSGKNGLCMEASQCPGTVHSGRPGCASFASNIKCCVAAQALPVTYGACRTSGGVAGLCTAEQSCTGTFDAGNCPSNTPFGSTLKCCPQVCAPAVISSSFLEEAAQFTPKQSKLHKLADRVHRSRQPENALTPMEEEESM